MAVSAFSSWRDEPLPALMETIRAGVVEATGDDLASWAPGTPAAETLRTWTQRARTLLVVLDQFEDYFLYHPYEDGPGTFGGELPTIVNDPNLRVHMLLSIREDALGKLDRFKGVIPRLFANYVRIEHLTRGAARRAIEGPIEEWNRRLPPGATPYSLEPALVESVLEATSTGELSLTRGATAREESERDREHVEAPFLQLVLERVWRATVDSGSHDLTAGRLAELGGAERIVENHLLEALAALTAGERDTAADVLRYLVTRSKTKIAHPASDLAYWTGRSEDGVTAVLDRLCSPEGGRILRRVPPPSPGGGATRYELFHDILAEPILEWRRDYDHDRRRRAAIRRFAQIAGALLVLATVLGALGIWALVQRSEARSATRTATSIALASASKDRVGQSVDISLLLALAANRADTTPEAANAMVGALTAARRSGAEAILRSALGSDVRSIAFSPDGRTLATGTVAGFVQLWDTSTPSSRGMPLFGHQDEVWGLSFSPDGNTLASASRDGTIRLWDVDAQKARGDPIEPRVGGLRSVAFSPDGRLLALAGSDDMIHLLDAQSRSVSGRPLRGHDGEVVSLAFSADGRTLVSGGYDRTVRLWDVDRRAQRGDPLTGHDAEVWSVALSPDGRTIASGDRDGIVRLWNARTGRPQGDPLDGKAGQVWSVAFSPDGKTLASSGFDDTVRLWSVADGAPVGDPLRGHTAGVYGVAFRRDGLLASAAFDATVRLWDSRSRAAFGAPLRGHTDRVESVAFSPDGSLLASAGFDRVIRLWDARTGAPRSAFGAGMTESIEQLAFSPDGDTLATATVDGTVGLWRVADGQRVGTLERHAAAVHTVAFSPDGSLLATGSADGTAQLWDARTFEKRGDPLRSAGLQGPVWSVAFAPDGDRLVYAADDDRVHVWDLERLTEIDTSDEGGLPLSVAFAPAGDDFATGEVVGVVGLWRLDPLTAVGELRGHTDRVESVAFSPDGGTLASAGYDGTVRLWDTDARRQLGQPLAAHDGAVYAVAFSPDGQTLASGGNDGTVRLWSGIFWRDRSDLTEQVCRLVAPGLSIAEWVELAPRLDYERTCPT
jgi:WD40 repeat protein